MGKYSSPWKQLGLNARAATSGLSNRQKVRKVKTNLPSMKEISNMKLTECSDYVMRFDGQYGKGTKLPNKGVSRRRK